MSNDLCCICGDDACDELREGSPVCDFHRSMIDNGYTLDELREERDNEDDDTQKLPDIDKPVTEGGWHATDSPLSMIAGQAAIEMPVDQLESEYVRMAERIRELEQGTQTLLEARNDLLGDEMAIHRLLATVEWSIDESVVVCVEGLVREYTQIQAERDALAAENIELRKRLQDMQGEF
jgi:DNA-binding transcriptional MerR regulator